MATQLKNLLNSWCLMEGWEGLVLLAIWFQWLCTKLMGLFFFILFSKLLLNPATVHCFFFFFFVLAVGATEERPEPSLKMFFFLFLKLSFCDFGNRA